MRVLVDNCVPKRFGKHLTGHQVVFSSDLGWEDLKDAELLQKAHGMFDVILTVDRSIRHQHRIELQPFALLVLRAVTNRYADLLPLVPDVLDAIARLAPGQVVEIGPLASSS